MAIGRTEDRENPWDPVAFEVTSYVWGPIRGFHLGQQSTRLHQQAGHMIASDQIGTPLQNTLQIGSRPHMGPGLEQDFVVC